MIIISVDTDHTIEFYSRETTGTATAIVYNEQTKSSQQIPVTLTYANGLSTGVFAFDAAEGDNHFIIVNEGETELAKFKTFCTDAQDLQRYALTDNKFVYAPTSSNEFITPED